jgi:TonB family protein
MYRKLMIFTLFLPIFVYHLYAENLSGVSSESGISEDSLMESPAPLEKEPVLKNFIKAQYPEALSRSGVQGVVTLDLLVSEKGTVDSIAIVNGIHPDLDTAVVAAVMQFTFEPAIADSQPVPVIITYNYRISLDDLVDSLKEYVNFSGLLIEKGTRSPVVDAQVIISFSDTMSDTGLKVPFSLYLKKIGAIEGQVLDERSIIVTTDSTGSFTCKSLPAGPVSVKIIAPGYEAFGTDEEINASQLTEVKYYVQRLSYSDYEIVVYGKREEKEVAKRTLTLSEIKKIPGFGGDAVKVIQALPGVARPSFSGGAIVVRGAPTWDSKFYLDGVQLPVLYHFGGVKSVYNSEGLESVNLFPGGFTSQYGSAIGGVIELKSRDAKRERYRGIVDANLYDASVFIEGPLSKKGGVIASVRRSYIGNVLSKVIERIDIPVSVVPYYYDYLLRADYDFNDKNSSYITLFGSSDRLELIAPLVRGGSKEVDALTDRVRQKTGFNLILSGWQTQITQRIQNNLRLAFNRTEGYVSIFGLAKFDFDSWEYYLRDELTFKINERLSWVNGLDCNWMKYHQNSVFANTNQDNTILRDTMRSEFGLAAGFTQLEYKPLKDLLLITGFRYDYYDELDYKGSVVPEFYKYKSSRFRTGSSGEPSLRLSGRYSLPHKQVLKAAFGTYNQTPQPMGFVTHPLFGNPALPATKARHIVGGYEWQITDLIFSDIQLYHNQQWDIPRQIDEKDVAQNNNVRPFLPDQKGRMYGLELLLRHDLGDHFFGWLAYSLSRSERFDKNTGKYAVYDRDQTHNLQLIASYKLPKEYQIGAKARYVTGNPYTPVVGVIFNNDARRYEFIYGAENSSRNDPFFQLDIRFDKKIVLKKWMLSTYIDLQNVLVFFYKSPEFTVYNFDGSEKTVATSPFFPSFGITAEF